MIWVNKRQPRQFAAEIEVPGVAFLGRGVKCSGLREVAASGAVAPDAETVAGNNLAVAGMKDAAIKVSMDGRGRWIDSRFIERLYLAANMVRKPWPPSEV